MRNYLFISLFFIPFVSFAYWSPVSYDPAVASYTDVVTFTTSSETADECGGLATNFVDYLYNFSDSSAHLWDISTLSTGVVVYYFQGSDSVFYGDLDFVRFYSIGDIFTGDYSTDSGISCDDTGFGPHFVVEAPLSEPPPTVATSTPLSLDDIGFTLAIGLVFLFYFFIRHLYSEIFSPKMRI